MKKIIPILAVIISSQTVFAHPGGHHTHETFIGEWGWFIVPVIAMGILAYKYAKKQSQKSE